MCQTLLGAGEERKGGEEERGKEKGEEGASAVFKVPTAGREGGTVDRGALSAGQREHKESTPRSHQPSLASGVIAQAMVQKLHLQGQLLEESVGGRLLQAQASHSGVQTSDMRHACSRRMRWGLHPRALESLERHILQALFSKSSNIVPCLCMISFAPVMKGLEIKGKRPGPIIKPPLHRPLPRPHAV